MAANRSRAWEAPSARSLLLHAVITAVALAVGISICRSRRGDGAPPLTAGPADIEPAREDLAAARSSLEHAQARLGGVAPPPGSSAAQPPSALADIVPAPDDPPAALDRFAERLTDMEIRTKEARLLAYYDMVTRPLLKGFDDATIERVTQAFARYIRGTGSIPWGIYGGQRGGAAESWRQVLEEQDRLLRAALAEDLPSEQVELLHDRFAMKVPAAGEALPTPKLAGTAR